MRYTLTAPMIITSRLAPGLLIGDGTVSLQILGIEDGRAVIRTNIDFPGGRWQGEQGAPWTGDQDVTIRQAASAALSFLGAEAEAYDSIHGRRSYRCFPGTPTEPADGWMFSERVAQWASENSDAIEMAALELNGEGE